MNNQQAYTIIARAAAIDSVYQHCNPIDILHIIHNPAIKKRTYLPKSKSTIPFEYIEVGYCAASNTEDSGCVFSRSRYPDKRVHVPLTESTDTPCTFASGIGT